jgi:palmitoyltransferase
MWAAYQGDAISVDILLKSGASISAVDHAQMTPLHWAAVKGSKMCIQHLVEAGADIHAREAQGKTPRDMAEELKGIAPWEKGLEDGGMPDGRPAVPRLSEVSTVDEIPL